MIDLRKLAEPGSIEETLLDKIDFKRLPRHIAVIMDGNGRWAKTRNLPRVEGHRAGITAVREIVETAARLEMGVMTLYAFSVENWKRPRFEVATLMMLLKEYLRKELATLMDNNIRFTAIGRVEGLDPSVQRELKYAEDQTARNSGLLFQIALNYGGRAEIVDTVNRIMGVLREREMSDAQIDEQFFSDHLYTANVDDPDLLIRTSGELRVSNFLLWQIAYAEIHVTKVLWPDFRRRHLFEAIIDFQSRDRRYGAVDESDAQMFIEADGKQG
ncbi:MAG: undecaprenyl diphosphate synthase [Thermoanaerobaculia bacterium]|jgi:undecaprenyl diphosphate synthase|nr:undecaprenyl diphosphate synthase [Thermoanaerobaculia bacterium]